MSFTITNTNEGEGDICRSILAREEIVDTPAQGVHTLYDVLQYSTKRRGDMNALGYRTIEQVVSEEKEVTKVMNGEEVKQTKVWKYFQLSPYIYMTYQEMSTAAHQIGSALIHLGLTPKSKIELFASTSPEWMLMAHGAFTQNMAIVTAYETLGSEGLLHSMQEAEVDAIYTSADLLKTLISILPKLVSQRELLILYSGEAKEEELKMVHMLVGERVFSIEKLKQLGGMNPSSPVKPGRDDLCCIMYTSGSTGTPKGVILNHSHLVGAIAGANTLIGHHITTDDTIMAYLPLAHVLEFLVENLCIFWGVTLGYANPRTLTDSSVRNCKGDIKEFKPSIMTGVPAVWETIRKGILATIEKASPAAQTIFHRALATKSWLRSRRIPTVILDGLVFNQIKAQMGGRFRLGLSGGAPIAKETQQFLSTVLGPILGAYGMTESVPVPCCEIKLVDVPDANYLSSQPKPQGEIWVRGSSITKGYFKQEALTREAITEDGWLRTGDVGEWNSDGTLSVIDRIKNLVKLSNGEYIALEKLESIYKVVMGVSNICVYGDSLVSRPVAIVMPVRAQLKEMAFAMNDEFKGKSFLELCNHPDIQREFLSKLQNQGKQANLKPAEILYDVHLTDEEWSSENNILTAAQKLKRSNINKHYEVQLNAM
ncbi:hypothetical protein BDB01DRAFT_840661 [Pilobolus umbonatus]|nr:hypothetical protein BDB01DRAFT_840661 [Pilobolus umbonatus]